MPRLDRDKVRQASPLEAVIPAFTGAPLLGSGTERHSRCLFHKPDHHPSLRVNLEKQVWHCPVCDLGGDVFALVRRRLDVDFPTAVRWLVDRAGLAPGASSTALPRAEGDGGVSDRKPVEHSNGLSRPGATVSEYAKAKQLPEAYLRKLRLTDCTRNGQSAIRTPFLDEAGLERAVQFRVGLDKGQGPDDRFRWKKGSKPCAYGLWRLDEARQAGRIVLVEGASDTQTLWLHNIPTLGLPSASATLDAYEDLLADIDRIDVVLEPDRGGQTVRAQVAHASFRARVWLITLPAKDPSALYLQDPAHFREAWRLATETAQKWSDVDATARQERGAAHFRLAQELLDDPNLLSRIGDTIRALGYAGDVQPVLLAYVAMTSRVQPRPMNLAFVAQSASGKNTAVDRAKDLMPPEAVHEIRACSQHALIYDDVDLQRKVVIFSEVDSIPDEGPAASAVRSLATDNEMTYDTVEKVAGRMQTRRIRKPGPTGFITTSTRRLPEQMSTRTLEVPISDDAGQTRAVLRAQAVEASAAGQRPDLAPFIALQRWLADVGLSMVTIPYAGALAELVPATAVRMRRDFRQLLACITAVALLHQQQRDHHDGEIVATIADYAIARDLLAPIFDSVASEGCTQTVRNTIEAVVDGEEVTTTVLATRLGLSKSTISYRTKRASQGGWLENAETRRGHQARWRRGGPLPESTTALPTPQRVTDLFECSNEIREPQASRPSNDTSPPDKEF